MLTAAPFVNAAFITEPVEAAGYLAQNHSSDREENNPGKHSAEDRLEYNNTVRNKHRAVMNVSALGQVAPVIVNPSNLPSQTTHPGFRLRPAYYCLLFLYQLF